MLGSWGLGGDEFSGVGVDVVEVGVVVVVVVGVVRWHLLDAGGGQGESKGTFGPLVFNTGYMPITHSSASGLG